MISVFFQLPGFTSNDLSTVTNTLNIQRHPIQKLPSPGRATVYIIDPNLSLMLASLRQHPNSSQTHLNSYIRLLDVEATTTDEQRRDSQAFLRLEMLFLKNSGIELKRGDVVKHGITRAIYIYDGAELVPLEVSWGDYGTQLIPQCFSCPEYPPMHFDDAFPEPSVSQRRALNLTGLDLTFEANVEWKYGATKHGDLTGRACAIRFLYKKTTYTLYFNGRLNQETWVNSKLAFGLLRHKIELEEGLFWPLDATTLLWEINFAWLNPTTTTACPFGCPECSHRELMARQAKTIVLNHDGLTEPIRRLMPGSSQTSSGL